MSQFHEGIVKVVGLLLALTALVALERGRSPLLQRQRRAALVALTVFGVAAWTNFGGFHTDGSKLHPWEQLHYVLGSKYYPELGYDGLYSALLSVREERKEELPAQVRDLRTMLVEPSDALSAHRTEVRARFSPQRWQQFSQDASSIWIRDEFFLDHGYLPTPAHTAVSRVFSSHLRFDQSTMRLFACLDFVLLGLAGWAVYSWVSLEALAAMALMFGLGFCTRYYWVGGAFLRQDWFAAVLVSVAALHSGRFWLAGMMLGYASMVRVFPALFVLPLLVHLAATKRRGQEGVRAGRFALGYASTAAFLFVAGCFQGRGPNAWLESATRLSLVGRTTFANAIGLRFPLITSLANFKGELVDPNSLYLDAQVATDFARLLDERFWLIALLSALVLGAFLTLAWRTRTTAVAFACGVGVIYTLALAACYYGSYFVVLAVREPLRTAIIFLLGQLATYAATVLVFWLAAQGLMVLNGAAIFVPTSVLLGLSLAAWWLRAFPSERTA